MRGDIFVLDRTFKRMRTWRITLLSVVFLTAVGCKKEQDPSPASGPAYTHIAILIDSAFIQAPNVVSANYDGINDLFCVAVHNVVSLDVIVQRENDDTVFHSNTLEQCWAPGAVDLGRYIVSVHAVSTSGNALYGQGALDVLTYGNDPCLQFIGTPVTADQFQPEVFGVTLPSNDNFCD
ncbi:MAG TPA: hypothetical protein P5291_10905 [Flavobacteriales bacterium]|nr:hypothetical protein [Flavobacteriales bacterium]